MDKFDRIFALHGIFSTRRTAVDQEELLARLECTRSTLFRILALMKDRLGAPIEHDSQQGGWRYAGAAGTWFQYRARSSDATTDRQVSPQRLTHYRESWYLDAWDEEKDSLRTFSVD